MDTYSVTLKDNKGRTIGFFTYKHGAGLSENEAGELAIKKIRAWAKKNRSRVKGDINADVRRNGATNFNSHFDVPLNP